MAVSEPRRTLGGGDFDGDFSAALAIFEGAVVGGGGIFERDDGIDKKAPSIALWPMMMAKFSGNDVMVRRGQGIPRVGESSRGDQVIQFKVDIPKKLSPRQEELLRELATELGENNVKAEKRGLFGRKK